MEVDVVVVELNVERGRGRRPFQSPPKSRSPPELSRLGSVSTLAHEEHFQVSTRINLLNAEMPAYFNYDSQPWKTVKFVYGYGALDGVGQPQSDFWTTLAVNCACANMSKCFGPQRPG